MALRGKKPNSIEKRLKAFFYGGAGVGKTTAAISFPNPYLIDTERGAENDQYIRMLEKNNGAIFQTSDFDELITEIKSLMTEEHHYKTLIIDPLTVIYNACLDKAALKVGTEFGRHYGEANKAMKSLLNLLVRLDMNVIITSHAKNEYGTNLSVVGQTFDCYKKLDYLFDLVVEVQKRGQERIGLIRKSRIENLPDGDSFVFSYDYIAEHYNREILERVAVTENLATKEQVFEFIRLIELFKIPEETISKWLEKAEAATPAEMNTITIQKCIDSLLAKINEAQVA